MHINYADEHACIPGSRLTAVLHISSKLVWPLVLQQEICFCQRARQSGIGMLLHRTPQSEPQHVKKDGRRTVNPNRASPDLQQTQ